MVTEPIDSHVAVRRDGGKDIRPQRFMHTLAQARLVAIDLYRGADVAVEPGKAGDPGDVLWCTPYGEVFMVRMVEP